MTALDPSFDSASGLRSDALAAQPVSELHVCKEWLNTFKKERERKGDSHQGREKETRERKGDNHQIWRIQEKEKETATSNRGQPTIVSSVFHGAESSIPAPIAWPCP